MCIISTHACQAVFRSALKADVKSKEGEINLLKADVKSKEGEINLLKADVKSKDEMIKLLNKQITNSNSTIIAQANSIDTLNSIIKVQATQLDQFSFIDFDFKIERDHEKFVLSGPFKLNMQVTNNSSITIEIDHNDIGLIIPKELLLDRKNGNKFKPDEPKGRIVLPPRSSTTIVWDQTFNEIADRITFRNKINFRSDIYRFVVNLEMKKKADYPVTNGTSGSSGTNNTPEKFPVTKEVKIQVDLDSIYISLASVIGAFMAVFTWFFTSKILLYREYFHDFPSMLRSSLERNKMELRSFLFLTVLVPPVILAMASYGVRIGVQIKVMDFIGGVATGFIVHLLVISAGHKYINKLGRD